jgi:ribonuclease BN (tRNA processing enzyme)
MRLTVLGKSPSWQDAGGACSGYLLEHDGSSALVDCGNGVFSKLRRYRDYTKVDAVVLSHMHADHFLDLVPFAYALTYAPRQQPVPIQRWPGVENPARPKLYTPRGASETFRRVVGAWGNEDLIENAFDIAEYGRDAEVAVGDMCFRFQPVPHFTETFAMCIEAGKGTGKLTFGADSRPTEDLVQFARGSEVMLIEATLPRPERSGQRGHLTPREAGEHGRAAEVKRLVLTHISDELDTLWARKEASAAFGRPVEVASEGAVFEI